MPIFDFPEAPVKPTNVLTPTETGSMYVCTIDPTNDKGPGCPACGWPTGAKHGVKR
jgi:hypothetical protein